MDPTWRPLLGLFGGHQSVSYVEINDKEVRFRFGRFFDRTVQRDNIDVAARREWPWWMGIGWRTDMRGLVGLIGSRMGVVEVTLKQPTRRWGLFPCESIAVSLDDPIGFIEALTPKAPRQKSPVPAKPTRKATSTTPRRKQPATKATRSRKATTAEKQPTVDLGRSNGATTRKKS
jgi:hypothetical protein